MIPLFPLNLAFMEEHLLEHSFKLSNDEVLLELKELFEFTTPKIVRQSLHTTLFAYLSEQAETGQDSTFKQVALDYQLMIEFLDKLESIKYSIL